MSYQQIQIRIHECLHAVFVSIALGDRSTNKWNTVKDHTHYCNCGRTFKSNTFAMIAECWMRALLIHYLFVCLHACLLSFLLDLTPMDHSICVPYRWICYNVSVTKIPCSNQSHGSQFSYMLHGRDCWMLNVECWMLEFYRNKQTRIKENSEALMEKSEERREKEAWQWIGLWTVKEN